ncbi:hypothetical protein ACIQZG_21205 [Lysinibacillus sp. NPDC096418]|uniref:hypothetical protein n=1 Tax=Lysinibacillus sp. NPDC096418 TaxID=3364138 RepID=UPI003809C9B4
MPIKWYCGDSGYKIPYYRAGDKVITKESKLEAVVVEYDFGIDDVKVDYVKDVNEQRWLKASQIEPNEPIEEQETPYETIELLESN